MAGSFGIGSGDQAFRPDAPGTAAFAPPPGSIDCHMHIYDPRVPFAAGAMLPHPEASVGQYRALQRSLGLSRAVVVAPSAYGADNSATVTAIKTMGADARGVAILDPAISDRDLAALHDAGIRGARFNFHLQPAPTLEVMQRLAPRVAELGWHVQVGMRAPRLLADAQALKALPGTLVLEHCAGIPATPAFRAEPAYRIVLDLIDTGRCWVKLSGPYLREPEGAPSYPVLLPMIDDLVRRAPQRLVWGSDWPHPSERVKPDDAALVALLPDWIASPADQMRILVTNPAELYDFPAFTGASCPERSLPC